MVSLNVDTLTDALRKTSLDRGVSFAGKGLKLDTAQDVKDIVKAIESCNTLEYLNLEGNTLGIEAAEAIAKALEKRSEFKRALWKDMFTGRMKTDIPIALKHLGQGLVTSSARLTELDLSDNAFGPIGVKGLVALLKSPCCYTLQELKLNNNGLGISGATMLAAALTDCYELSKKSGKALGLKLCIIGRNRLENEGATALANVFKLLGTLEEIHMTQNGIYHPGISALSDSFKHNKNLRILNLNDNTIGPKGAEALSKAIPYLTNINVINFGDCLLKTSGAKTLAESLHSCTNLQELTLSFNEIRLEGALAVIKSLENKKDLSLLALNGNKFGEDGIETIKSSLKKFGKSEILDGMDDDEGDSEDEDEDDEVGDDCKSSDEDEEEENDEVVGESCTIEEFLENPTAAGFIGLGENLTNIILTKAKVVKNDEYLENFVRVLMSVSSIYNKCDANTKKSCLKCCSELYKEVFAWGEKMQKMPVLNNTLLIYLGLIKSEDKKFVLKYDVEGCLCVLEAVMKQNGFPEETKRTLEVFIKRDVESEKEFLKIKMSLLGLLKSNV